MNTLQQFRSCCCMKAVAVGTGTMQSYSVCGVVGGWLLLAGRYEQLFSSWYCRVVAAAVGRYEQCISCSVGGVVGRRLLLVGGRVEHLISSWCYRVVAAAGR